MIYIDKTDKEYWRSLQFAQVFQQKLRLSNIRARAILCSIRNFIDENKIFQQKFLNTMLEKAMKGKSIYYIWHRSTFIHVSISNTTQSKYTFNLWYNSRIFNCIIKRT